MEPISSFNTNSIPTDDVPNMLATLIQSQKLLTSLINILKEDVDRMKVITSNPCPNVRIKVKDSQIQKPQASQKKLHCAKYEPPSSFSPSPYKNHKPSPPSSSQKTTTKPPAKQNPLQMQTSDFPPDSPGVEEALFVNVKVLWGILEQNGVPTAPGEETLVKLYHKFSSERNITTVIKDSSAPNLVDEDSILTLAREKIQKCKLGSGIENLSYLYIGFIRGALARLGIKIWCPNLAQSRDDLYNVAFRIVAVTTFQQIAVVRCGYETLIKNQVLFLSSKFV
ncbi:hypothetical protein O181_130810 [Austropuccinia psidii MF-1]|uniref:Uncharacterized protein n=1 Tax=Austropuccinia psidii MF-1 TaxID=1389203 RepID=A0A9Q3QBB7_9BASI|nr:hypothetical protein [Austropuccinia psidii MF-1]